MNEAQVTQFQEAEKAPVSERPTQINDTTHKISAKEAVAFEALCSGLTNTGLLADEKPLISYERFKDAIDNCMDALRESGLLDESKVSPQEVSALEAIRRGLGASNVEHDDWEFIASKVLDELKKAGVLTGAPVLPVQTPPGARQLVASLDPGVGVDVIFQISEVAWKGDKCRWNRSRAKAQEIVAAIVAEHGGEHVQVKESHGDTVAWLTVSLGSSGGDTEYNVYYDIREFPQ